MTIQNINNDITTTKNTIANFVLGKQVIINEHNLILRVVDFLFSPSCADHLKIQIKHGGKVILPDVSVLDTRKMINEGNRPTNYIKSHSSVLPLQLYLYEELNHGDKLEVWYKNNDVHYDHNFRVIYVISRKRL